LTRQEPSTPNCKSTIAHLGTISHRSSLSLTHPRDTDMHTDMCIYIHMYIYLYAHRHRPAAACLRDTISCACAFATISKNSSEQCTASLWPDCSNFAASCSPCSLICICHAHILICICHPDILICTCHPHILICICHAHILICICHPHILACSPCSLCVCVCVRQ